MGHADRMFVIVVHPGELYALRSGSKWMGNHQNILSQYHMTYVLNTSQTADLMINEF